jgi:sterol desaturase/sphingolipid hydroxylase (fatty acid hydroxylase superfamily)
MTFKFVLDNAAQWLNEHAVGVTVALAAIALLIECICRVGGVADKKRWVGTWFTNGALLACALLVSWLLAPWLSPAFSDALGSQTGILVWLGVPNTSYVAYVLLGVLLLDLMTYALHRLLHAVPLLWRLHQVHHSDGDMNASTHFRQHPLQLVVAMLLQLPMLWLLGVSGVSWVLYGALSAAIQLWQHAALDHSSLLDRWLRPIFVTPAMHRVHHDHRRQFHDTNYGALFSLWDRLLGTYTATIPDFRLGLNRYDGNRATHQLSFVECLLMPIQSSPTPATTAAVPKFQTHLRGKR